MQGDMPDGSFSEAELERLQREGIIEMIQPGTPEAAAFDQQLADELEAADAELLALEGPDAFTSTRMLRQTALRAEHDPERVAYAFAAWCRARGWERSDLASWLGVTVDQLAALAIHTVAGARESMPAGDSHARALAECYGANPTRFAEVLG
jgi:hypothetical protein